MQITELAITGNVLSIVLYAHFTGLLLAMRKEQAFTQQTYSIRRVVSNSVQNAKLLL